LKTNKTEEKNTAEKEKNTAENLNFLYLFSIKNSNLLLSKLQEKPSAPKENNQQQRNL
jgi:hypothetical protein